MDTPLITSWDDLPKRGELIYKEGTYFRIREVSSSHADASSNQYNLFGDNVEAMSFRILAEALPEAEQDKIKKD